jgi:hypothetical protein
VPHPCGFLGCEFRLIRRVRSIEKSLPLANGELLPSFRDAEYPHPCPLVQVFVECRTDYHGLLLGGTMSLGTDLLDLRRKKASTVAALIGGIEWLATAKSETTLMTRSFALCELSDAVLVQVAVYALESYWSDTPHPKLRPAPIPARRKLRRPESGQLYQRRLFA